RLLPDRGHSDRASSGERSGKLDRLDVCVPCRPSCGLPPKDPRPLAASRKPRYWAQLPHLSLLSLCGDDLYGDYILPCSSSSRRRGRFQAGSGAGAGSWLPPRCQISVAAAARGTVVAPEAVSV